MKLSIITINLNNRGGLKQTIDSVVSQTFHDFEWIVIDGDSTDGSKELIELFADHFAYWVSEPDKGIYNAMNKGIMVSHGDYLLFLNSGDWLHNSNVLNEVFDTNPTEDIIYCDDGGSTGMPKKKGVQAVIDFKLLYTYTICHQTIFYKKHLFDNGLYDEKYKIVSDWKFLFQHLIKGNASSRKINIILCVLQAGSSYDTSQTEVERQTVLHEFYSEKELAMIEEYLMLTTPSNMNLLSYINRHRILKKILKRMSGT
jgi:glycosyltransferase involved in cell wall biosynthesis